jgi:predicted GNAT superfamily acetyltransferase
VKRTISGDRAPESFAPDDVSIEIPRDINSLQQQQPREAFRWREETRAAFTEAIRTGYKVVGFTRENQIGKYLLRRGDLKIL